MRERFNRGPTVNSLNKRWVQMVKADLFGRTKATLRDLFRGDECFDFVIRRSWWATAIISEKLPSGLFMRLADHPRRESQRSQHMPEIASQQFAMLRMFFAVARRCDNTRSEANWASGPRSGTRPRWRPRVRFGG